MLLRQHILNIMCKGETSWTEKEQVSTAFFEGLERMQALAEDGLVDINDYSLKVSAKGKRFLRNICMTLDARLWKNQPTTPLFSMAD